MKSKVKKFFVCSSLILLFGLMFGVFGDLICASEIYIPDPMLLKALNNSMNNSQNHFVKKSEKNLKDFEDKEFFDNKFELESEKRDDFQEIFEEDVSRVCRLKADSMGILDISGIEYFTSIISTIDLSNNNISDISPLFEWVQNKKEVLEKENKKLKANIFLGGNNRLFKENFAQIYELLKMGKYIYVYDSQRNGEGIVELPGFVNGRPVEKTEFDKILSDSVQGSSETDANQSEAINTGKSSDLTKVLSMLIFGFCFIMFSKYIKMRKQKDS